MIEINAFSDLSNLKYLYLRNNLLRQIQVKIFGIHDYLKSIDLKNNQIESIDGDFLIRMKSLIKFD